MTDLAYLALIWAGVYLSSYLAEKTKLTPVVYFLGFGFVTVNLGLLPVESTPFLDVFSEIGIILIMFALGFEENTSRFVTSIKRSWGIAFFGALAPFITAYFLTFWFWGNIGVSILCGLAMTATAVSLTMVSLKSEGLQASAPATGIMTSAVLDDIASLALVAILVPIATGDASLSPAGVMLVVTKAIGFFLLIVALGLWIFPEHSDKGLIKRIPMLGRLDIKRFLSINQGERATLALFLTALVIGLIAHGFGFHPAIGAYMAGLVLKEEYFQFHERPDIDYHDISKKIVDDVAYSWIGPVFFVMLGSKLVFETDIFLSIIPETIMLFVGLFCAQITSASLAARYTGNFDWTESMIIGFGMLGRAELAFVVMDIAFIDHQIISREAFYTLMGTAFCLNVSVPLTIMWFKPYYLKQHPHPKTPN